MGIGIVGDNQEDITPFQRQVFEQQKALEAEKKQERMDQAQNGNGAGGRPRNSAGGATSSRSETIRYESEGERDDDDLLEVI